MIKTTRDGRGRRSRAKRRGAVAVEFAVIAPVLVTLLLGMAACSKLYQASIAVQNAARQGVRLAGMDRRAVLDGDQSTNDKIIEDIQNFLTAAGFPGEHATVSITHPDTGQEMDLDDPNNEFELFETTIEMPLTWLEGDDPPEGALTITRSYVFRNARPASLCD